MRKPGRQIIPVFLLGLLAVTGIGSGQVIENPAKPKAANAGRVVVPQEVLAISDEGTSDFHNGEFLWVVERSEDETVTIKKYRVGI